MIDGWSFAGPGLTLDSSSFTGPGLPLDASSLVVFPEDDDASSLAIPFWSRTFFLPIPDALSSGVTMAPAEGASIP